MIKATKKVIAAVIAAVTMTTAAASAFEFPEPDWGALLKEKRAMSETTEFELYAEANAETAPYFGARLEPRSGAYIGMVAEASNEFAPVGSYLTYIDGMYQADMYYPANEMVRNNDVVTTIGWTITSLDNVDYNKIQEVLDRLASYNKPMFIRFANEMNVSSLGDDPTRYVDVFRRVADMIHQYPNFAVVWSPNDLGALNRPFHYYYPGDQYVDWIGISSYGKRYFQGNLNTADKDAAYFMTGDYAWATNAIKPIVKFMEENNIKKPIMLSECGVSTNTIHGTDMTDWATPRLRNLYWYIIMKYPQVKLINSFNVYREGEAERYDISGYPYAAAIYKEASNCGAYLRSASDKADFVFQPANYAGTLTAKDGIVKLHTLAYIFRQPNLVVNYSVDGNWYSCSDKIPYTCNLNISALADGKHTLKINSWDQEKTYEFYKRGNAIKFGGEPDGAAAMQPVDTGIKVTIDGELISFEQNPVAIDGRTLVPMRKIFTTLGATVDWDNKTKTATGTKDGTVVSVTLGSNKLIVNGEEITLDVAAQAVNGNTMVPTRAIAESFNCDVDWDGSSKTVVITKK